MRHSPSPTLLAALLLAVIAPAQDAAPVHPVAALGLGADIPWLTDGAEFFERTPNRVEAAAVDRSALLDAACAQAKAGDRLVLWYVHRIQEETLGGRQMYRAPVLDIYSRQVLFTDPEVTTLIDTNFVPVRAVCDEVLSQRFGLRPLQFVEPAVVFLDGDGKVLHCIERIRTFHAEWFRDVLVRVLGQFQPVGMGNEASPDLLRARGRYREALTRLSGRPTKDAVSWLQIAQLQRLMRLPDQAMDSLAKAAALAVDASGDPAALLGEIDCERGLLLTHLGRTLQAQPLLEQSWRSNHARSAEAGYLWALNALRLGDEAGAMRRFQLVATRHPAHWAGRKAAANTLLGPDDRPFGAAFTGFESVAWLPDAAYRGLPRDTTWAGDRLAAEPLTAQAVRFLLAQQRDDGGFTDARYAYWPSAEITPNVWIAITALSCAALLEHRAVEPAAVDAALRRGEAFLFDEKRLNRGFNEDVYSDSYRLLYLSRKAARVEPAERAAVVDRMNALVAEAAGRQKPSGFWAHEYENAFCTGAMLWGLVAARQAGATVPAEVTDKGVAALLSARTDDGAYAYSGRASSRTSSLKDSSGRGPVCEGTLLALGRSDLKKVRAALDNMWQHMDRLEQVRRNDFHSDGELGGFFFFHSVFHASEVLRLLPEDERPAHGQRFLELLQRIPEMDGSFLDSHELGRSYGTAMALLTLANLRDLR